MIKLLRCDDRLIHGQCMTQLVKLYDVKEIIVVDDYTATNPFLKKIFQSAVPKNMTAYPVTLKDSIALIKEAMGNDKNTIVLMRVPSVMVEIYKEIPDLQKDFNIASVVAEGGTIEVTKYARMNEKELNAVKEMDAMGVHLWFNLIPSQPTTEWDSIKSNF